MFSVFQIQPVAQIYVILNTSQNRLVNEANSNKMNEQGSILFHVETGNFLCITTKLYYLKLFSLISEDRKMFL
jgi:hypothetical protein